MKRLVGLIGMLSAAGCARSTTERLHLPQLETVSHVDLRRYLGSWYEIASFPQRFQRGCTRSTATYALREDGELDVVNSYAVVGHPSRDYLWTLSRTPTMNEATYQTIVARLQARGYETSRLVRTVQGPSTP
jgi:apolipoprotein D and lipocalin family protein